MKAHFICYPFFLILFFSPLIISAQGKKIFAKIVDEKNIHVPYANIVFKMGEKGLASDEHGEFSILYFENDLHDSLWISAIGYEKRQISLTQLLSNPVIVLPVKNYQLFEIPVSAREAENMVKKAIERIPENYPQSPYLIEMFFRQFHRENGKAARLIEAVLTVYDPGYINPQSMLMKEKFEITELRRSKVFEKNGFAHDDHLVSLFKQNIVHYPRETILNSSAIDYFHFEKDETQHSDTSTCIKFFHKNPSDPKTRWGKLYIGNQDFAVLRMEENTGKNDDFNPRLKAASNSEWKFFEGEMTINYKRVSRKYYLDSISFFYRHNIVSKIFGSTDFTVDEYFNLWTEMPDTVSISTNYQSKNFQNSSNLYSKKYTYNSEFWESYLPSIEHPLDPSIVSEFEKNATLEEQFLRNENP